jgi:hypothetical protein
MSIMQLYRTYVPDKWRMKIHHWKMEYLTKKFIRRINAYYSKKKLISSEEQEVLHFICTKGYAPVFPYAFPDEYNSSAIEVFIDDKCGLRYVLYCGHKLYFKRSWSEEVVRRNFNYLLIEQDHRSPHCYLSNHFIIEDGEVLADIGAAEGNFALAHVDKLSKIYLFEHDEEWIEALQYTFAPWQHKVEIIKKYVSDKDDIENISIDQFFLNKEIHLLKIDVDGGERALLRGAIQTFTSKKIKKTVICTYHYQDDYLEFRNFFERLNPASLEHSSGFMFFREDTDQKPPFMRRGLLRIKFV